MERQRKKKVSTREEERSAKGKYRRDGFHTPGGKRGGKEGEEKTLTGTTTS